MSVICSAISPDLKCSKSAGLKHRDMRTAYLGLSDQTAPKWMVYTPGPLYNTVSYNTALDMSMIIVGLQMDYFCYMSIHFTLIITRIG